MLGVIFLLERLDLPDHLVRRHAPVLVEVALPVIAEGAPAPVAAARGEVRQDPDRHEVAVQREPVEIRQRQRRGLLGVDLGVDADPSLVTIDEVGHLGQLPLPSQRLQEPQQRVLPFVQNRGVEHGGEEPRVPGELLLEPRDDIPADRDVNVRERLLDHLAEGEAGEELHLRADRHADHVRRLTAHRRQHQLTTHVPVDVDLLVVQTCEDLLGHARPVSKVALHRVKDEGRRVICRGDVLHDFTEDVEGPLQLVRVIEVLAAGDALGFLRPLG